ncbi:CST complex subunit STN1 isoform X1 [Ipomoea triloba]|uniref:CST complex subunit STN1 isoform X1 n=1 Tax=Ipomoea triloba TaxID=35885 RepID=UPI00125E57AA|nr:CST complex subunit STN1 isoform X1 [Ipomoea triloba]XP_031112812.1 CST complex subunit STN1 isoform X1 [Ipomoea triloba]XP_031112813.1 CST complex subunit STN1 isoform X1 [Ipomoea triloba]
MDAPASLLNTHVKLLALDLLAVVSNPVDQTSFSRNGVRLCRVETMGVIVSREFKPGRFLKFSIDDTTGCIPCVLWLNQFSSPYFSRRSPADVRAIADMAAKFASEVQLGVLARVRGKIAGYRGSLQITVADVIVERDPNFEILHWLDCVKLSRNCYNVSTTKKSGDQNC